MTATQTKHTPGTITSGEIAGAYLRLYPSEVREGCESEHAQIIGNWLERFKANPEQAISPSRTNWYGKVTRSLFCALGLTPPNTKSAMIEALKTYLATL